MNELERARINRELVKSGQGAETYDQVCHARYDGYTGVYVDFVTLDKLEFIAQELQEEDYE